MSGACQYTTFFAGPYHFAIDVDCVREVVQPMTATPVPMTGEVVCGLVNLRGQIITAVDLRARLELPSGDARDVAVSLIVRTGGGLISLRADRLGDVLDLETYEEGGNAPPRSGAAGQTGLLEPIPDTVGPPLRDVVRGVLQLEETLLLVLDPEQLLTVAVGLRQPEEEG